VFGIAQFSTYSQTLGHGLETGQHGNLDSSETWQ
jgi:hypothetical protein